MRSSSPFTSKNRRLVDEHLAAIVTSTRPDAGGTPSAREHLKAVLAAQERKPSFTDASEQDAMDQIEIEALVKNIDGRTKRIEQILPTLATKDDLKPFATKDDLKPFATKDDLKAFPTKDDLKAFATKDDLKPFVTKYDAKRFATKDDLKPFATKDDVREEGERTRRHFDMVASAMKAEIAVIAEGHKATKEHVEEQLAETGARLRSHDKRIMKLESKSMHTGDKPKRR